MHNVINTSIEFWVVSLSRVLIEAEGPCLRDMELLFHRRNIWPISYEMSRTFISRAVHGEAHFSRPEEEQAQNRKILKCFMWKRWWLHGRCSTDGQGGGSGSFLVRNRILQAIQGQLGPTKPGQLGNDMSISVCKRITMEEIWRGTYSGKRFISGIPARSKNQEKMVRAWTTLLHKGD